MMTYQESGFIVLCLEPEEAKDLLIELKSCPSQPVTDGLYTALTVEMKDDLRIRK